MRKSKVILLSTVCFCVYAGDLSYASYGASISIPKSAIHTYYTSHAMTDTPSLLSSAQFQKSKVKDSIFDRISGSHSQSDAEDDVLLYDKDNLGHKEASVCFITDAGNCSGDKFGKTETPGSGNGAPGGVTDEYDTQSEQCVKAGYTVTSCLAGSHGDNPCPADSSYYKKCVCDANITETCTKPYYGVGPSCDGKYASCQRDDDKACREDGYSQTAACSSVQIQNKKCPYNSTYYDKCVCRSDLVTCTYPQTGVGTSCGGKYASCQCPSSYKSCDCGGAVGATACTVNGITTYSSCKTCCENIGTLSSCPSPFTCTYESCSKKYYKSGCRSGYAWNSAAQTCTKCDSKYQYACTGDGEYGSGDSCGGRYATCSCSAGYSWNSGYCRDTYCDGYYLCDGSSEAPSGSTCRNPYTGVTKYSSCSCTEACHEWSSSLGYCVNPYTETCTGLVGSGSTCGGKYKSCKCSAEYKYSCKGENVIGFGGECDGKYKSCICSFGIAKPHNFCYSWNGSDGCVYNPSNKICGNPCPATEAAFLAENERVGSMFCDDPEVWGGGEE